MKITKPRRHWGSPFTHTKQHGERARRQRIQNGSYRSVREIGANQAVYESKILNLEAQQKYDRKALQDNQTKLEAQVQYFITGGWK